MPTINKSILSLLFFNLLTVSVYAQTTGASIAGVVIEADTEEGMEFVTVMLYDADTKDMLQGTVTDSEGKFRLSNVALGEYYVKLTFIGFKTKRSDPFVIETANEEIDLEELAIEVSESILEDIEVVAEKSTYQMDIDRKVYNVEKDIMSSVSSATDIMRNIPSVTVDVNGQINLRGTSNITYFINGRPSALLRNNAVSALQQMPANTIERIEVITNPSAKYKPDGVGGIINIVLKEESLEGINGTLTGNVGNLDRYNGNVTLNYGMEDMNIFGSYGYRHAGTPREDVVNILNYDGAGTLLSTFDETIDANRIESSHLVNAGMETALGEGTLEISGNYYFASKDKTAETITNFVDKFDPAESLRFDTDIVFDESEWEYEAGAAYEYEFDDDHTLVLEYNYANFNEKEDGIFAQRYTIPTVLDSTLRNVIQINGPTQEVVAEYAVPVGEDTEVEVGYTGEFMEEEINFTGESFRTSEGTWMNIPDKTSRFIFNQNIHAFYATVGHSFGDLSVLAGLRAEQALVTSNLVTTGEKIPNDYFRLYPTLHLGYELSDNQEIQLSYSKRVNRADSDEQNPFPEYSDPNTREVGNPLLKPEQIHSIELGYRWQTDHFTFLPSIYYRYKEEGFTEVVRTVDNNISETYFTNLENDQTAGFEFILTGSIAEKVNWDFSANTFYQQIDARNLGFSKNKNAFTFDARLGANIKITKSTFGQLNAYYRSSRITPQGEFQPIVLLNAGVRQDIIKNQASILLTVSDIFQSLDFESIIDTPILNQRIQYGRNNQIVYLGFIYHFGHTIQKKKIKFEDELEAGKKAPEEE